MATVGTLAIRVTANAIEFEKQIENISKGLRRVEREFGRSSRRLQMIGRQMMVGVTAPIVGMGAAIVKTATEYQKASGSIVAQTGAMGDVADSLRKSYDSLLMSTDQAPASVAQAVKSYHQGFGVLEDDLERVTAHALEFAKVWELDVGNVANTSTRLFAALGRDVDQFESTLDALTVTAQRTGAPILGLMEQAIEAGPAFEELGFSFEHAIAQFGQYYEAGARAEELINNINRVAVRFAREGITDMEDGFRRLMGTIEQADSFAEAILIAERYFDPRVAAKVVEDVRAGLFDIDELLTAIRNSEGATALAAKEMFNWGEVLGRIRNIWVVVSSAAGEAFAPTIDRVLGRLENMALTAHRAAEAFSKWPTWIRRVVGGLLLLLAAIGPVTFGIGLLNRTIAGAVGVWSQAFEFFGKIALHAKQMQVSWARAAIAVTGKTKLIVAAVIAVVLASIWLLANWDKVRAGAAKVWAAISGAVLYASAFVVRAIAYMVQIVGWLFPALQGTARAMHEWADSIKASAQSAWKSLSGGGATADIKNSIEDLAKTGQAAADSQEDLADGFNKAGKAAMKNLQSFDEVHSIEDGMAGGLDPDQFDLFDFELPEVDQFTAGVGAVGNALESVNDTLERAGGTLRSLWDGMLDRFPLIRSAVEGIGQAVQWVRDNWETVGPVIEGIIGFIVILGTVWLLATFPILGVIALIIALAVLVIANWDKVGPFFTKLWEGIVKTVSWAWETIKKYFAGKGDELKKTWEAVWGWMQRFWEKWGGGVTAFIQGFWRHLQNIFEFGIRVVSNIIFAILAVIRGDWEAAWEYVKDIGQAVWDFLVATWENIYQTAVEIWDATGHHIIDMWENFKGWLAGIWESIREGASNAWRGIVNVVIGWINDLIGGIEGGFNWAIRGINSFIESINDKIRGLNKVPRVNIPLIGTLSEISMSRIPQLAIGTDRVLSDGLAYLHRGESIVPAHVAGGGYSGGIDPDAMERAVYLGARDGMLAALAQQGGGSQQKESPVYLDGQAVGRILLPILEREAQRLGFRLIPREA